MKGKRRAADLERGREVTTAAARRKHKMAKTDRQRSFREIEHPAEMEPLEGSVLTFTDNKSVAYSPEGWRAHLELLQLITIALQELAASQKDPSKEIDPELIETIQSAYKAVIRTPSRIDL